jgi:hypothetical protein
MKRAYLILALFLLTFLQLKAQVVLNEIYTDPGSGKHEFFELYNTSSSGLPENLDCYTIVTYYEESGGKTGFYVMDLPNQNIPSRGFYSGASANPFNVQGQTGLVANFNWNAMPAGGALYKMERSGGTYNSVAVPANLNDLFYKRTGGGANYSVMIYKNGSLVSAFFGGTATAAIPAHISSMPNLPITMLGSCPSFTANFSTMTAKQGEYVTPTPGVDNGYIRAKDGKCGTWDKGSAQTQHTPGASNGTALNATSDITVTTFISCATGPYDISTFRYNVTGGPADYFPLTVEVYRDLGLIGKLDSADVLINTRIISNTTSGTQSVNLPMQDDKVILVAKTVSGCIDLVLAVNNTCFPHYTLPVRLTSFNGSIYNKKITLTWSVANNENATAYEIERSFNGRDFFSVGKIPVNKLHGSVDYHFVDTANNAEKTFYRLKFTDMMNLSGYSNTLTMIYKNEIVKNEIKLFSNPVSNTLSFSYPVSAAQVTTLEVFDLSGKTIMSKKLNSLQGINHVGLPVPPNMNKGTYLLVLSNGIERLSTIILKN